MMRTLETSLPSSRSGIRLLSRKIVPWYVGN
jgi:hypothetical protein